MSSFQNSIYQYDKLLLNINITVILLFPTVVLKTIKREHNRLTELINVQSNLPTMKREHNRLTELINVQSNLPTMKREHNRLTELINVQSNLP